MSWSHGRIFWVLALGTAALAALVGACSVIRGDEQVSGTDPRLGGGATVEAAGEDSFTGIAPNATAAEKNRAADGFVVFDYVWTPNVGRVNTTDSATQTFNDKRDGLGPTFNARSCQGCHLKNGPSPGPMFADEVHPGLVLRPSVVGEDGTPGIDARYNEQLQTLALNGVSPEGRVALTWDETEGRFDDGGPYSLRRPVYAVDPELGAFPPGTVWGPRIAPHMVGTGLLEAVPADDLRAAADPDDEDGDGISGRVAELDAPDGEPTIGRFGWKAAQPSVEDQVAAALWFDSGITSRHYPTQNCPAVQIACIQARDGGDPDVEIVDSLFDDLVAYVRLLGVPEARFDDEQATEDGAAQFEALGCGSCHTPTLRTGESDSPTFADQTIHPFTDLLLHDMGEGLDDGRPEGDASGAEWRTPPLWGLGLGEATGGSLALLHDGRAATIAEAILWHGGEAQSAADAFRSLPEDDREALLAYLESL